MRSYSVPSGGTTEETAIASIEPRSIPLSASSPAIRSAISSPVAPETVRKRQCSTSSVPSKAPRWVWVLPMSTARSIRRIMLHGPWKAKLYVIPASHPSRTAAMMLDAKGIPFKRVDLMPVVSKGRLRLAGFDRVTVPALKLDGRKVQGSREITRELDRDRARAAALSRRPRGARRGRGGRVLGRRDAAGGRPPHPLERAAPRPPPARLLLRGRSARRADRPGRRHRPAARRALGAPQRGRPTRTSAPTSRRCRGCSSESTTGSLPASSAASGSTPATYQVATSVRLLMTLEDLRAATSQRGQPGQLAMRVDPAYPGSAPRDPPARLARTAPPNRRATLEPPQTWLTRISTVRR